MSLLQFSEREIRAHGPGHVLAICWRRWRAERRLARHGVRFRSTVKARVEAAYGAMSEREFAAINGAQAWANWRTIPRALSGRIPDRPLRVLDLGCGTGTSTQVLAFYCPAGSYITGYDLAGPLVAVARNQNYRHRSGAAAKVYFVCQCITAPLEDAAGRLLANESVDVVNSCGVVGHHLGRAEVASLLKELGRILHPEGLGLLDPGPNLPARQLRQALLDAGFQPLGRHRSWFGDPTGVIAFRKTSAVPQRGKWQVQERHVPECTKPTATNRGL